MNDYQNNSNKSVDRGRRQLLQGAVMTGVAAFAPAVFANELSNNNGSGLSGKLICKISDPVKTLVLRNNTNQKIVVDKLSKGALMFDGSVVDCNAACVDSPLSILPGQEIEVRFRKTQQFSLASNISDYQRIQSRVTRLGDGTRVIPFEAKLQGSTAVVI